MAYGWPSDNILNTLFKTTFHRFFSPNRIRVIIEHKWSRLIKIFRVGVENLSFENTVNDKVMGTQNYGMIDGVTIMGTLLVWPLPGPWRRSRIDAAGYWQTQLVAHGATEALHKLRNSLATLYQRQIDTHCTTSSDRHPASECPVFLRISKEVSAYICRYSQ